MSELLLNLADAAAPSFANGPGARAVLWAQGCSIQCHGCHNPHTWSRDPVRVCSVDAVVQWFRAQPALRGITLSGGEPFEQAKGFAALCRALRAEGADVVAFSGLTRRALEAGARPFSAELLAEVDLLIDGPYLAEKRTRLPLRGSSNQRLHFLSGRIRADEITNLPVVEWMGRGDRAIVTGFSLGALDWRWRMIRQKEERSRP